MKICERRSQTMRPTPKILWNECGMHVTLSVERTSTRKCFACASLSTGAG